ncbi:MerR family transcriptional regulator [Nocardia cyriacigeorgica]|uniref:MerR family transcriptional regulator n=1 Tax=Nocardia cyriacigeorgica TaxID=135487 RepID=UPI001895A480|nr:MerR family transcriptional regulator [Nocardia cyriacigeorgica]MBF6435019.1 MerR family transcriptional regulator [Nocardia cyriacigeorgica]MBF6454902.1 MerR family transcriptional regulator [Nocardia cyriacigeorgica]MBF6479747.1 MerR family transcriptional regulator [Nocardia cyriacigeorgica]MBF6552797.1 MerR family transcriptional regulator [Nocardia cyriacigeorgica]
MSIGELSRRTGVAVRTLRFYCDEGLLAPRRTAGGHRVFEPAVVDQVLSMRRMRALGLGLAEIAGILSGDMTIEDAIADARHEVSGRLDALSWRHASLLAIERAAPGERAARLELLAQVPDRAAARSAIISFWRRVLAAMPTELFDDFVEMDVPRVPAHPTPDHVIAFAELVRLVGTPELDRVIARQLWRTDTERIQDRRALLLGVADAYAAVAQRVLDGHPPCAGPELDRFVAVHAEVRGRADTTAFRRELAFGIPDTHPATSRYWTLTGAILGTEHTTGTAQRWLHSALSASVA